MLNKRGQITIFVIIAIILVAAIVLVIVFRDRLFPGTSQSEFASVYESFDSCVRIKTREALSIAGTQAGYINLPNFEPGSEFSPFSSQLDFLGNPVPYWYYVSGNNIIKYQNPTLSQIENQISEYLESEIRTCGFSDFRRRGLEVNASIPRVRTLIEEEKVNIEIDMDLTVERDDSKEVKSNHKIEVYSKFGKFYKIAQSVYLKEEQELFLENYAIDVMYNYAPVTGVEFTCSPMTWNPQEVVDNILLGLSANIGSLRGSGGDYKLSDKTRQYFVVDVDTKKENVAFMYMPDWPSRVEIWPVENGVMYAEPVGLEQGMGILGFCYVPYHFVYDIYFPVLVQIYDDDELFQFPVSVVIDKSYPRNALPPTSEDLTDTLNEFCNYKNTEVIIYTFDKDLNPIEADISYTCLNQKCFMGTTTISGADAILRTLFPQCIDGKILARAEGYLDTEQYISTNEPTPANVIMKKLYELDFDLYIDGSDIRDELVLVSFESEDHGFTILYPGQNKVSLSEGYYNISVQVFGRASVTIPASSTRQCVESPRPGILGLFGSTEEKCFEVEIPAQTIENGLIAGGRTREFILEDELKANNKLEIAVSRLPSVTSLEQLQKNYELIETQNLALRFS